MTSIYFEHRVGGVLTDVTSAKLEDTTFVYGVRRVDNAAVVVAAGTAMSFISTGIYRHTFTDPAPNLQYQYEVKWVYAGETHYSGPQITGAIPAAPSVPAALYALTSRAEIERLFSTSGVDFRVDDLSVADQTNMFNSIIGYATDTVAAYTLHRYNTTDLMTSRWVRDRATFIGAWMLSRRRGNPGQYTAEYEMALADLEKVLNGRPPLMIPGVPVRAADVPTVSSYRVDDRYRYDKLRVARWQSTKPYAGQPFFYDIATGSGP
jgi:hypothetical protein